jgi:broad specificity phosphatase PhoE
VNTQSTTIYIVRHGQSEVNIQEEKETLDKSFWDAGASPLTELGIKQAKELAKKLKDIHFDAAFSSNLLRAKQTLEILIVGRNIPFESINTIHERKQGNEYWKLSKPERKKLEEAVQYLEEEEKFFHKVTPDSESAEEAVNRFQAFLDTVVLLYKGKQILVVNHGGLMRFLLMKIGWAKFDELPSGSIENTGYYVLETDGETHIVREAHGINKRR